MHLTTLFELVSKLKRSGRLQFREMSLRSFLISKLKINKNAIFEKVFTGYYPLDAIQKGRTIVVSESRMDWDGSCTICFSKYH